MNSQVSVDDASSECCTDDLIYDAANISGSCTCDEAGVDEIQQEISLDQPVDAINITEEDFELFLPNIDKKDLEIGGLPVQIVNSPCGSKMKHINKKYDLESLFQSSGDSSEFEGFSDATFVGFSQSEMAVGARAKVKKQKVKASAYKSTKVPPKNKVKPKRLVKADKSFEAEISTSDEEPFCSPKSLFEGKTRGKLDTRERATESVINKVPAKVTVDDDSVGPFCDLVRCTISWLETGKAMIQPVQLNNGIVYELEEFGKKIAWESEYVVRWLLRLNGYINVDPTPEDMKKVHLMLKRRKAISITFAGKQTLKRKLYAFDSGKFSLPTAEKLDIENYDDNCPENESVEDHEVLPVNEEHNEPFPKFPLGNNYIGDHCRGNKIDIKQLNLGKCVSASHITKGVVYELYHFFIDHGQTLTSLVHTLFRLKGTKVDDASVAATLSRLHNLVRKLTEEGIQKNADLPYEVFELLDASVSDPNADNSFRPLPYEPRRASLIQHKNTPVPRNSENEGRNPRTSREASSTPTNKAKSGKNDTLTKDSQFDLNCTKGDIGKITRGDIVYLYTRWLKRKMDGSSNGFVSNLFEELEILKKERQVEDIRIPVGTLMSTSVKLFDQFRILSKVSMHDAREYLIEDWMDDVKGVVKPVRRRTIDSNASTPNSDCKSVSKNIKEENVSNEFSNIQHSVRKECHSATLEASCPAAEKHEIKNIVDHRIIAGEVGPVIKYRVLYSQAVDVAPDQWISEDDIPAHLLKKFWTEHESKDLLPINDKCVPKTTDDANMKNAESPKKQVIKKQFNDLYISSLDPTMVNYQLEVNRDLSRRMKISKRQVLQIYNEWRENNKQMRKSGSRKTINVEHLHKQIKDLMDERRVRNFNTKCLLDTCYRMTLMCSKLNNDKDIDVYLDSDYMEMMEASTKHLNCLKEDNATKLQAKRNLDFREKPNEVLPEIFAEKVDNLQKLEKGLSILASITVQLNDKHIPLAQPTKFLDKLIHSDTASSEFDLTSVECLGISKKCIQDVIQIANRQH